MSSALYMSHFPNFSLEGDQDHGPTLTLANDPSLIYPFVIDNSRDQGSRVGHHEQTEVLYPFVMNNSNNQEGRVEGHDQREINEHIFMAGSSTESSSIPSPHGIMTDNKSDQQSLSDHLVASHDLSKDQVQGQWMPSNIRFVRKMMNSDRMTEKKQRRTSTQANQQDQTTRNSNNNSSHDVVRVCSACNTTKTPLWRTGPCGPKSLCNACGIRQRKARRAALAAANGGLAPSSAQTYKVKKDKRSADVDRTLPIKKRCKINTPNKVACRKITTKDEIIISLSKNSAFHRVFPQDETDAAILLMALSCSLVHS
ncbi:putative GATA transcription factor 22 [Carex littledalei]|uniref:Putative GATA transcription factor 22 n=1 Tax=Carex littledalei TaxID=544730 RepID=A0A833VTN7_9POAL|nr:putative GATA transcription factor 22 [Carex littledalei]